MTTPRSDLKPNTYEYEMEALVKPTGFREYDARWLFGEELNPLGAQALGLGLAHYIHEIGVKPRIVVGHDYRSYSQAIKQAVIIGLMQGGCEVLDIGLSLSPMAYFAQFDLNAPCVAMVTASHNENGWTGVKMGANAPLTFGPDEMGCLKEIVLNAEAKPRNGGRYERVAGVRERYIADVAKRVQLRRPIKVVAACGNGTPGAFAAEALRAMGADVIEMDCALDHSFPRYNPNPEDLEMLHEMAKVAREHDADLAVGFDGDGDRCGVVDDTGEEIFADKIGLMLARDLAQQHNGATFVVDVKSTGLFMTDSVLKDHNVTVDYWKTGHSYIKRRVKELGALAGFEKSGHFFFNEPYGRGYDDGLVAAAAILGLLDRNPDQKLSELKSALPVAYTSPTMSPKCADERKYEVVNEITDAYKVMLDKGETILGRKIADVNTVNGVRVTLEDGAWVLVRPSSNKPVLVVVVESPNSADDMTKLFREEMKPRLGQFSDIGAFDQEI